MVECKTKKTKWERSEIKGTSGMILQEEIYYTHTVIKVFEDTGRVFFEFWKSDKEPEPEKEYQINAVSFTKAELKEDQLDKFVMNILFGNDIKTYYKEGFSPQNQNIIYAHLSGVEQIELAKAWQQYKHIIYDAIACAPLVTIPEGAISRPQE